MPSAKSWTASVARRILVKSGKAYFWPVPRTRAWIFPTELCRVVHREDSDALGERANFQLQVLGYPKETPTSSTSLSGPKPLIQPYSCSQFVTTQDRVNLGIPLFSHCPKIHAIRVCAPTGVGAFRPWREQFLLNPKLKIPN